MIIIDFKIILCNHFFKSFLNRLNCRDVRLKFRIQNKKESLEKFPIYERRVNESLGDVSLSCVIYRISMKKEFGL